MTEKLNDRDWRLNNLYHIKDERGYKVQFNMNWAQRAFFATLWFFNVVLKARQLGFTTFILIYFLDACLFNPNHAAGVIAHTREDAEDLFKNKVKFAYDNLPEWLKAQIPATQDSSRKLEFANGSSITVGTSLRSGTYQKLLVSEYGKIAARYPEKATEIKTGALNTVHAGQQIFVESTAEGRQGEFFDLVQRSRKLKQADKELTTLDPKFHFFPWFRHPGYVLSDADTANTSLDLKAQEYFAKLKDDGIELTPNQKSWYVKKSEQQGDQMKREFPSTPDEAFEASLEGAYYVKEMANIRQNKQICRLPYDPSKPVHTFWDLGNYDFMAIWFFQHIGREYRFIRYLQSAEQGFGYFQNQMSSFGYVFGKHYWPHDGIRRQQTPQGLMMQSDVAKTFGIGPIEIVSRTADKLASIRVCKTVLPRCHFDEVNCAEGIKHLDSYRKEWNDKTGMWNETPRHDESSHCADAFRTFVEGYKERQEEYIDHTGPDYASGDYNMFG